MDSNSHFDLEACHEEELVPLIRELCDKANNLGLPIFVVVCYASNNEGVYLASSARGREDFVPQAFHLIRAVVEGNAQFVEAEEFASKVVGHIGDIIEQASKGTGKN